MFNRTIAIILTAAIAAGLGLWLALRSESGSTPGPNLEIAKLLPQPRVIAPFALSGPNGRPVTQDDLRGRWTVAFLGFTHCPDVCPTTLAELASAEKRWREALPEPQRPQMLFVSVDPERDSPDRVGDYAQFFSPHALAATGSVADLERFGASLLLVFTKVPLPGDNADAYTIDHSTQAVLIDPHGRFAGFIRPERDSDGRPLGMPPDKVARDLIALAQWQP